MMFLRGIFLRRFVFAFVSLCCCVLPQLSAHVVKDKNCPTCGKLALTDSEVKKLRIMSFIEDLKQKLQVKDRDFSEGGNMNLSKLPAAVIGKKFEDVEETDVSFAVTEKVVITGDDVGHQCHKTNDTALGCFAFNMNGLMKLRIDSAMLWVYKAKDHVKRPKLLLYDLKSNESGHPAEDSIIFRSELGSKSTKDNWVTMDLTHHAKKWMDEGADTRTLGVKCNDCATKHYKDLYGVKDGYKPLLVINYSKPKKERRQKRRFTLCNNKIQCCRQKLELRLNDYDLGYIIEPKIIDIGYCGGACTAHFQAASMNAFIRQDMFAYQPMNSTMRQRILPCCVPKRKKTTWFLIKLRSTIMWKAAPRLMVEECGCM